MIAEIPIALEYGSFGLVAFFVWWLTMRLTKQMERSNDNHQRTNEVLAKMAETLTSLNASIRDATCRYPDGMPFRPGDVRDSR